MKITAYFALAVVVLLLMGQAEAGVTLDFSNLTGPLCHEGLEFWDTIALILFGFLVLASFSTFVIVFIVISIAMGVYPKNKGVTLVPNIGQGSYTPL